MSGVDHDGRRTCLCEESLTTAEKYSYFSQKSIGRFPMTTTGREGHCTDCPLRSLSILRPVLQPPSAPSRPFHFQHLPPLPRCQSAPTLWPSFPVMQSNTGTLTRCQESPDTVPAERHSSGAPTLRRGEPARCSPSLTARCSYPPQPLDVTEGLSSAVSACGSVWGAAGQTTDTIVAVC